MHYTSKTAHQAHAHTKALIDLLENNNIIINIHQENEAQFVRFTTKRSIQIMSFIGL